MMNKGDKARVLLLAGITMVAITALGSLIYGLVLAAQASLDIEFTIQSAPLWFVAIAIVVLGLQLVACGVGLIATLKRNRAMMTVYYRAQIFVWLLEMGMFIFVLLAGNGVFSGNTGALTETVEANAMKWILENPAKWVEFQDREQCCGFSIRSVYNTTDGGLPGVRDFQIEENYSGAKCVGVGLDAINDLKVQFPTYSEEAQKFADNDDITLRSNGFKCFNTVVSIFRSKSNGGGVALGLLVFLNGFAIFYASNLLYSIKIENGGMKPEASFDLSLAATSSESSFGFLKKKKKSMAGSRKVVKFTNPDQIA